MILNQQTTPTQPVIHMEFYYKRHLHLHNLSLTSNDITINILHPHDVQYAPTNKHIFKYILYLHFALILVTILNLCSALNFCTYVCGYTTSLPKICLFVGVAHYRFCGCSMLIIILLVNDSIEIHDDSLCRCRYLLVIKSLVNHRLCRCSLLIIISLLAYYRLYRCSVLIVMWMLHNDRLCRCSEVTEMLLFSVLIVMLMFVKCRLCRCNSVLIKLLLLANYRLCRCIVVIENLLLSYHRLCRCSVLIEILLLASYRLWRSTLVIEMLLLVEYRLSSCCVVIGILLLEVFRLCRRNALTSVCYHYSSLT